MILITVPWIDWKQPINSTHRRLPIPAQLPPPFYPSTKLDPQTEPVQEKVTTHASHPWSQSSPGSAAFNAPTERLSAPGTPFENGPNGHVPQVAQSRPPPGFAPPEFTPSFFPGHSHHPSVAGGPLNYPPFPVPTADVVYRNGIDTQQALGPTGPATYSELQHDKLISAATANGTSTSHSQTPDQSPFGERNAGSERGDEMNVASFQNRASFETAQLEESPLELAAYLSTQFGNPEFADFILQIRSLDSVHVSIPVHGIVVVRSPTLAAAVGRSVPNAHRSRDARRLLDVSTADPFVTRESLEEAIKVLYGAPLLSAPTFLYGLTPYALDMEPPTPSDAPRRMRQLLSYIAAGRALQMPSMVARGVEIARALLRWDTVDQVLYFALQPTGAHPAVKDGLDPEDPFAVALLNYAIDFMAFTFPVDFKFYNIAPELQELPRLPIVREARSSAHNPRLSKIRFGDAPPEDEQQPNIISRTLSSILLSLPTNLMNRLFNHRATANQIGWTGAVGNLREVARERENRRRNALTTHLKSRRNNSVYSPLLGNLHAEERLEQVEPSPLHPSGYALVIKHANGET